MIDESNHPTQDAIAALNTLQSNAAVIESIRHDRKHMNELAIPEMREWVRRIEYEV